MAGERWNHNIHYHRLILDAVPRGARSALDVGAGDGLLTQELRARVPQVTAVDLDRTVTARGRAAVPRATWIRADVMTHAFDRRFDVVASMATLHHLPDLGGGLRRLADLTEPGGVVVIVGLAANNGVRDRAYDALGALHHRWHVRNREYWEHTAPIVWPPPHTYREVRDVARAVLPSAGWRRLPMWRYALTWHKPGEPEPG